MKKIVIEKFKIRAICPECNTIILVDVNAEYDICSFCKLKIFCIVKKSNNKWVFEVYRYNKE